MTIKLKRPMLAVMFVAMAVLSAASCGNRHDFVVFQQTVEGDVSILHSDYDRRFLAVTGLRELHYTLINELSTNSINQLTEFLMPASRPTIPSDDIVFVYVYTTNAERESRGPSCVRKHTLSVS